MIQFMFNEGVVRNEFGFWLDLEAIRKKHNITDPIHLLHCVYEDYQRKSQPQSVLAGADLILGTTFNPWAWPPNFANELTAAGQDLLPQLRAYFEPETEAGKTLKKVGGK